MQTFEEFIDSSDEFVCIVYMQDGYDAEYDNLSDAGADAQEKTSYLAQWDYGSENEYEETIVNRAKLVEEACFPLTVRSVAEVDGTAYLLVEQPGTGASLFRAVIRPASN